MIHAVPRQERRIRRRLRRQRTPGGRLIAGAILAFVGVVFLLNTTTNWFPGFDALWPVFPILAGFGSLLSFLVGGFREPRRVFGGVMALGVGVFFLPFTLGLLSWDWIARLWPVFPLIAGVAHFWIWLASFGRQVKQLVPAVLASGVGVVGLLFTLTPIGNSVLQFGWPLLIIAVGLGMMLWGGLAALLLAFVRLGGQRLRGVS